MSKKIILFIILLISLFTISSCKKKEENTNIDKEITITDEELINNLSKKTTILFNIGKIDGGGLGTFISKNNTLNDIKDIDKLTSILIYASMNPQEIPHSPVTIGMYKKYLNNWFGDNVSDSLLEEHMTTFYTIDGNTINDIYKNLYNSNITNYDNNVGCPKYQYKQDENKYLVITTCGNGGEDYLYTYNYQYTKDNNHAYVYTSIAILDNEGKIYTDYEKTNEIKNTQDFTLNKDNYQEFTKYKITFTYNKDIKDYIFNKVEKIN